MFNFILNGAKHRISFKHVSFDTPLSVNGNGRTLIKASTECHIEPEGAEDGFVGEAFCSVKDQFNKATGRKLSLNRAACIAFPGKENKAVRQAIYISYDALLNGVGTFGDMEGFDWSYALDQEAGDSDNTFRWAIPNA
jgi:hypothetical protein